MDTPTWHILLKCLDSSSGVVNLTCQFACPLPWMNFNPFEGLNRTKRPAFIFSFHFPKKKERRDPPTPCLQISYKSLPGFSFLHHCCPYEPMGLFSTVSHLSYWFCFSEKNIAYVIPLVSAGNQIPTALKTC